MNGVAVRFILPLILAFFAVSASAAETCRTSFLYSKVRVVNPSDPKAAAISSAKTALRDRSAGSAVVRITA